MNLETYPHRPLPLSVLALLLITSCGEENETYQPPEQREAVADTAPSATEVMSEQLGLEPEALVQQLLSAQGAIASNGSANLFAEELGMSQADVDAKLATAISRFFGIGTDEGSELIADSGYRLYFELPQDHSQAFIWAPDSEDIRSEGMSYGMMIAVQAGLQEHFDRLWKFSQTHLQYAAGGPVSAWEGYFRWQGSVRATEPNRWTVNYGATTVPAPDGEEYFAAALFMAHRRWGSEGAVNYLEHANALATAMLHNESRGNSHAVIHKDQDMVVFVPSGQSNSFSDPSYHLPAFYEIFALDGPTEDAARWLNMADISRQFLVDSANATTGLHPDYANFNGSPNAGGDRHDEFRYDAWRVVMNMALDYDWFSQDARMKTQVEKYHDFFAGHLGAGNVSNALFALDGGEAAGGGSTALTATLAVGAFASEAANRRVYVENLWQVGQQSGLFRYYQQCVYLLGLLSVSGHYGYAWDAGE